MSRYKKPSDEAKKLHKELKKRGINALLEVYDQFKHIDIGIPDAKLNIEVDGIEHYLDPEQIVKDINRSFYSQKLGYTTIHIPNFIINTHLKEISNSLFAVITARVVDNSL